MNCIAVIPARSGSKRIPKKNIISILGKPAISYAIETARNSGLFSHVYVSTDSEEIAQIAKSHGASVGELRDPGLSGDYTTTIEVVSAFIKSELNPESYPDYICCIYPVTPLLTVERLAEGASLVSEHSSDFVFAAIPTSSSPERGFSVTSDLTVKLENSKSIDSRTQDLAQQFQDAGQFYWGATKLWLESYTILGSDCHVVKLNKYEVVDVDETEDLHLIEILLKAKKFVM